MHRALESFFALTSVIIIFSTGTVFSSSSFNSKTWAICTATIIVYVIMPGGRLPERENKGICQVSGPKIKLVVVAKETKVVVANDHLRERL